MKLGVMAAGLGGMGWEKALDYCKQVGLDAIELPVGAYPGKPFFEPEAVLKDSKAQQKIKDDVARRGLQIIGLAVHGNPVSPDPAIREPHLRDHDLAVRLAPKLGTDVVINFSGCPGGSAKDAMPNWVTCAWPPEYGAILKYQWDEVLIPFWARKAKEAASEGVKIAFEAHPGFCVYNPETILRLREHGAPIGSGTGHSSARPHDSNLGANLDPSHFFWQGIDPIESARVLGDAGAIFHVHGKDTGIDPANMRLNGGLDTKSYGDLHKRSWVFRTCGYGHGDEFWKPFISMLRVKGYDGVISIEHEDSLMSVQEGFEKAVAYLRGVMIQQLAGGAWWF
ncbi:MAG: sugar phosphate isomerase/epimerase [Phycisphaerae bacterium]|jgi:sugar phosphate isomerase/epimerase|nr:sugar phosphate isomerase/epimerase [Phycisphaerae bacterium]MCZ2399369.1 sugar phosphate isomerase/epimerase [Phycisphaerae bacterium]NUQ49276.1 sugar phosphate isomerase/epimerase [Phycisphaerae bacterium]